MEWGGDTRDSLDIVTDEHGIGQGFFVLPNDSTEYWIHINSFSGSTSISTEPSTQSASDSTTQPPSYPFYIYEEGSRTWDSLCFGCDVNGPCAREGVEVSLSMERLQVPQEHLLSPMAMSPKPEHSLSEREFRRRYPLFAYDWHLNNSDTWPSDTLTFSATRHIPFSAFRPSDLCDNCFEHKSSFALPPQPEGVYRATLTLRSPYLKEADTHRITLFPGRMPFVSGPVEGWIENEELQVGDTLRLHLETWLPDQQAIISVQFNANKPHVQRVRLSNESRTLAIPVEQEGIVTSHCATACQGEMLAGSIRQTVGELGKMLKGELDSGANDPHDALMPNLMVPYWSDYRHGIHRPSLDYPARHEPLPNVWDYLEIRPHTNFINLYCPGEYWHWRAFSNTKHLTPSN